VFAGREVSKLPEDRAWLEVSMKTIQRDIEFMRSQLGDPY